MRLPTIWSTFDEMNRVFEDLFTLPRAAASFPPVNVLAEKSYDGATDSYRDDTLGDYIIEVALSGFRPEDVDVNVQDVAGGRYLTIESKGINEGRYENIAKWYNRGIAGRAFKLSYALANNVDVKSAELQHGLLRIRLGSEKIETKIKKIPLLANEAPALTHDAEKTDTAEVAFKHASKVVK